MPRTNGQAFKIKDWLWPIIASLCVLLGFALRNSDSARWALTLYGVTSLAASVAWIWPFYEAPSLKHRPQLAALSISFIGLVIALSILPIITLVTGKTGADGGLYDPSMTVLESIKLLGVCAAFGLGFRLAMNDEAARRLMDALLYLGGLWAAISIVMFIIDPGGIYGYEKFSGGRLSGAFGSANSAATLFGSVTVMAFARLLSRFWQSKGRNILEKIDMPFLAVFVASIAALVLSLSRMGVAATFMCLIVVGIILSWKRLPLLTLGIGVVLSGLLVALMFWAPMQALIDRAQDTDTDAATRARIFQAHFDIASKQPWFGFGLGSFDPINQSLINETNYLELYNIKAAHNVYLQWFEETGSVGLLALVLVNLSIVIPMIQAGLNRKSVRGRLWAILAAYCVFLIHGFTDFAFQEPALTVFISVVLGLGLAMTTNSNRIIR